MTLRRIGEGDWKAAEAFDASLPVMEKRWMPSQEELWIMSRSTLD